MPVINRPPIGIDNDDEHHKVIIKTQTKNDNTKMLSKTVMAQHEEGGLWTHGMIKDKGNNNHHDISYHIHLTKRERLVTQNRQHIKPTQISAEQYLHEQLQKHTRTDPLETILTQLKRTYNCN